MLKYRGLAIAAAVLGVAACSEQEDQTLPFDPATTNSAQGTVAASGGVVTLASGAEVSFPNGALSGSSQITIGRVANPTLPSIIGTPIGSQSIQIGAAGGASLVNPAQLTLLASQVQSDANGWLADFAITNASGTEIASDVGVDLSNGRIIGNIPAFGTITPVIPPASELVTVGTLPSASVGGEGVVADLFTGPVRTISQDCRARASAGNTIPACTGFSANASGSLLNQVGEARLARPRIQGTITLTGDPRVAPGATASGSITIRAVVRVRQAGSTAGGVGARIPIEVSLSANANSRVTQAAQTNNLTLSNFTVTAARPAFATAPVTFTIVPTSATAGAFVFNGTVNLGNNTTGQIQARFPFTIGY